MTKKLFTILCAFLLFSLGMQPALAQMKIGYVDTQKIMTEYQPALDAQKKIEDAQKAYQDRLAEMRNDFLAKQKKMEQQSLLLSDQKKQEQAQELQDLYQNIQKYAMEQEQQELPKLQSELMQPVIDAINNAIQAVGKAEGYDYILEAVNLLYANETHDITEKVMAELKKETK